MSYNTLKKVLENADNNPTFQDKRQLCVNDVDFQSSTNDLFAHWAVPKDKQYFVKEAYWAVEERALVAGIIFFLHLLTKKVFIVL